MGTKELSCVISNRFTFTQCNPVTDRKNLSKVASFKFLEGYLLTNIQNYTGGLHCYTIWRLLLIRNWNLIALQCSLSSLLNSMQYSIRRGNICTRRNKPGLNWWRIADIVSRPKNFHDTASHGASRVKGKKLELFLQSPPHITHGLN